MRSLSLQNKLVLFISVIILIALAVIMFIIYPALKQIGSLRESIGETERFIEEQYLKSQHLRRSLRQKDEVRTQVEKFYSALVNQGDELRIITELENLAQKHSLEQTLGVAFVNPALVDAKAKPAPTKKRSVPELPYYEFSFINEGDFNDHLAYLKDLEKLNYYLIIDSMSIKRINLDAESPNSPVVIKFVATIYANPI